MLGAAVLSSSGISGEEDAALLRKPLVVLTGAESRIKEKCRHLITSEEEWARIWLRHRGRPLETHDDYYNKAGVPLIDFESCMVLALFQGPGSNSAGLRAMSIHEGEEVTIFRFDDKSYQTMERGDKVSVYGFFILPRSSRTLIVQENVQALLVGKPVWKEVVRFEGGE